MVCIFLYFLPALPFHSLLTFDVKFLPTPLCGNVPFGGQPVPFSPNPVTVLDLAELTVGTTTLPGETLPPAAAQVSLPVLFPQFSVCFIGTNALPILSQSAPQ